MSINVDYKGVEIGTLPVSSTVPTFVAGRAVQLNSSGNIDSNVLASARILGLIKEHNISGVINEISGSFGIYGPGKATVLTRGIATVRQSVYSGISYNVYNQALTYAFNDEIFANPADGVLTNVLQAGSGPNGLTSTRVGRVLTKPTNPANGDPMQITVEVA